LFVCVVLTLKVSFFRVFRNRVLNISAKTKRKQITGGYQNTPNIIKAIKPRGRDELGHV
jgi:hypothetical protein